MNKIKMFGVKGPFLTFRIYSKTKHSSTKMYRNKQVFYGIEIKIFFLKFIKIDSVSKISEFSFGSS